MTNTHATWLREHAGWLDASMGYVAIPAARMRDAANEIDRLQALVDRVVWSMQKKAEMDLLPRAADEPSEPLEPTPEMIRQGIWAWERNERGSTADDVRAIYIAMRRMEGRSQKSNPPRDADGNPIKEGDLRWHLDPPV